MKVLITGLSHKLGGIEKIIFDYISHSVPQNIIERKQYIWSF